MNLTKQEILTIRAALTFWARACRYSKVDPRDVPFIAGMFGPKDPPLLCVAHCEALAEKLALPPPPPNDSITLNAAAKKLGVTPGVLTRRVEAAGLTPWYAAKRFSLYSWVEVEWAFKRGEAG